jgi:hypothetical protein
MRNWALRTCSSAVVALLFAGCGGGGPGIDKNPSGLPTLGEIEQRNEVSVAPDSDGDYMKDDVEALLGTDPKDRDSDGDGLMDHVEVFGVGDFDPNAYVPDNDRDGLVAARDNDDDGDGVNDGLVRDTDDDGVSDFLEYYGYTYDWMTGRFVSWSGDPKELYVRTDPLQPSTDQDPYSDGMEVSGAFMDVAVETPGDNPLVPAYPNLILRLVGYAVTLNEDITYAEGESLAKGQSWTRSTASSYARTSESHWDVGMEIGYSGLSPHAVASFGYGESYSRTNTTSTSTSSGASVLSEANWSCARSMNPTDAARLKLLLKVENRGSAPASNIIPTLTLRIGGVNVATFEPGNSQINMLEAGGCYPAEEGVYWVVDTIDTGVGVVPLSLTMSELRALEAGAPVNVIMTQVAAEVMVMDAHGKWVSAGDCNEYVTRCDAVCANLRFDLLDGSCVHYLVYAHDSRTAPPVTLRDALNWVGVDENDMLYYVDKDGLPASISLEGWTFVFDPETLEANGYDIDQGGRPTPDFSEKDMILGPETVVLVKAPRDPNIPGSQIHFGYIDPDTLEVRCCVSDYEGIVRVALRNASGSFDLELEEEVEGTGFYGGWLDSGDILKDVELWFTVENLDGVITELEAGRLYVYRGPWAPDILMTRLDVPNRELYANVKSSAPHDLNSDVKWVRAYHPALPNEYIELDPVVNAYEDPHGYACKLPANFNGKGIKVVAYVAAGIFAEQVVDNVIDSYWEGTHQMRAINYFMELDRITTIDFDEKTQRSFDGQPAVPSAGEDIWLSHRYKNNTYLNTNGEFAVMPVGTVFDDVTRAQLVDADPQDTARKHIHNEISENSVIAVRTTDGRYAKLLLTAVNQQKHECTVTIRFVVYPHPGADAGEDRTVVYDPSVDEIEVNGAASHGAQTYAWSFENENPADPATPDDNNLPALDGANSVRATFDPELEGDYHLKLVVNAGTADEAVDYVRITVVFPIADPGDDEQLVIDPDTERVEADGSASTGAQTYSWTIIAQTKLDGDPLDPADETLLKDSATDRPSFKPKVEGIYTLELTINKGKGAPYEDTKTVKFTVRFE